MSFEFNGSYIYRDSGNPTSTSNFGHCFWIKRTADFAGRPYLGTIRNAGESVGNQTFINDPASIAYGVTVQNYGGGSGQVHSGENLVLDTWHFCVLNGSGGNWTLKIWDGTVFVSATFSYTAFNIASVRWGSDGYGSSVFPGRMAHLRFWSAPLSDAEAQAEMLSATSVKTTGFLSAHSGTGGTIAAALTGESGTAFLNGGSVIYSADQPLFDTFTGITITGTAELPGTEDLTGPALRKNYILQSGTMSDPVWQMTAGTRIPGAVVPPAGFGTSQRLKVVSGAIKQVMTGLPQIQSVAAMAVRRVDSDFVSFRHLASNFASGVQGIFNLTTGVWGYSAGIGGYASNNDVFQSLTLTNGWFLIWASATISGDRVIEFAPVSSTASLEPAIGKSVDVAGFQYEDVIGGSVKATYHKPTTTTIVSRSLTTVTVALSSSTVGVGQTVALNVLLLDNVGDPWDQFGPVDVTSSDLTKVTASYVAGVPTDRSGRMVATLTGVATGTSTLTAFAGDITSAGVVLTVGAATARFVDIQVEPGWQGTSGWHVAVYEKHATDRFPSVRLFIALNQAFAAALYTGKSRVLVPVPSGVSVTVGQIVEVVIENDNYQGKAVDGPGIFPATVI